MNGGLSQVDSFDPKPMLDKYHGQPLPGGTVATERKTGTLMKSPFDVHDVRQERHRGQRAVPARRRLRRRHLRHPLDAHRHPEPRAVDADDEHRPHPGRPSVARRRGSPTGSAPRTRTCPATSCSAPTCRPRSGRRCGTARSCRRCTRARSSRARSSSPIRSSARTSIRRSSSRSSTTRTFTLPEQRRELDLLTALDTMQRGVDAGRSAARSRDQLDGDRLPDADRSAGGVRHPQGERGDAGAVRPGQHGARLPDGGAAGRARRAHGAGLLRQGRSVGRPRRHPAAPQEREGFRPAVRGGDQGPEVTRAVRRHAGGLRIGVRPHAGGGSRRHGRRRRAAAITTRSASRCGWPAAASRAA